MTRTSESKSRFELLLSEIYARRLSQNNKRVCIDCLKPRSTKNKSECKKCGCIEFYVLDYRNSSFQVYKMAVLSKIKPHSDAVDYL